MTTRTSWIPLAAFAATAGAMASPASATETHAIHPAAPWARALDDDLSKPLAEQWYGPEAARALRDRSPRWQGTMLLDGDTLDEASLEALGIPPIPAEAYDASPGVLFINFDGVTLTPDCPTNDQANGALNCSPLVDAQTNFAAWGDAGQRAAIVQTMQNYLEAYDVVITTNRPPDWLPYTMAVVGGTAAQAGQPGGVCGVANVQCDGIRRNHVSLNFAQSCPGVVGDVIAQETSHNWGLEHTNNPTDLLYPTANGGFKEFVDNCMPIVPNGENPVQCGYVHDVYCPGGGGEQQNSHAEMLGVFGPRSPDTTQPQIIGTYPAHGAQISADDTILITADIDDDSSFVGVKWTWVEGLPPDIEDYTRCTNKTCTDNFDPGPSFDPGAMAWDFLQLSSPIPVGSYTFRIEVVDSYANYASQTFTFQVVEGEGDGGSVDGGSADGGAVDETGASMDGGGDGDDGGGAGTGGDDGASGDGTSGPGLDGGDDGKGGCRLGHEVPATWGLLLFALAAVRRRDR